MNLWKRILGFGLSIACVCALIPSMAFAAPVWNDSAFLSKDYEAAVLRWQANSYLTYSGGVSPAADEWGDGLPVYHLPSGGTFRFHNVGVDHDGRVLDAEVHCLGASNMLLAIGSAWLQPLQVGDVFEFWVDSTVGHFGSATITMSLYYANTNTPVSSKLAFGVYDIDVCWPESAESCWVNSSDVTMYQFAENTLSWSGNRCWTPGHQQHDGYARSTACYMVSQSSSVNVGFSGWGCGVCYSFQGVNIEPDSPYKVGVDSK